MAVKKVAKFLVPVDEDKNEHKKNQLRELGEKFFIEFYFLFLRIFIFSCV